MTQYRQPLMDELRRQDGAAFFFASHDSRLLARMDRVVELRDGHLQMP